MFDFTYIRSVFNYLYEHKWLQKKELEEVKAIIAKVIKRMKQK